MKTPESFLYKAGRQYGARNIPEEASVAVYSYLSTFPFRVSENHFVRSWLHDINNEFDSVLICSWKYLIGKRGKQFKTFVQNSDRVGPCVAV